MTMPGRGEVRVIERNADSWCVREVDSTSTPGALSPVSLICEGAAVVRRLWRFPADWRALPDRAVLSLFDID